MSPPSAGIIIAQLQHSNQVAATRRWYMDRLAQLNMDKKAYRKAALALLADKGVVMLRAFCLVDLKEAM